MWLAYQRSVNTHKFAKSPLGGFEAKMLAVGLCEKDAEAMIEELNLDEMVSGRVCIAAINSPLNVTLSGDGKALEAIQTWCKARNLFTRCDHHLQDSSRIDLMAEEHITRIIPKMA